MDRELWIAVKNGQLASFSSLLQEGSPMTARVLEVMFETWTNRGSEFFDVWLQEDGNLNGFYNGSTPLNSTPSVVRLLVEHGARTKGIPALHAAATTSATEIDRGDFQPDPSRVEVLASLLDNGADVNEMEVDPRELGRPRASFTGTPLHRAVKYGSLEAVQCLLAYGADASAPSWSGVTALKTAQIHQRQDVIDALQKHIDRASG
ncbi:hypothetical protein N0V82_004027 [Gnomoniopsis sp. IMI 355080]|nr:hypothetical protein N0V82_004027 [Gnomoniopsis sp. IMI 355080]